jgi:lipopolysaccharide transport system ATP-binding protein
MPVIQIDNVSKSYRLGAIGGGTLREDVARWWARVRGRPDPFLKIGQEQRAGAGSQKSEVRGQESEVGSPTSDLRSLTSGTSPPTSDLRPPTSGSDLFWALRHVSLEVKEGEILGIIGRNGAGKSTLLKILSRVTGPTEGEIRVRGRIASLLEVGTGFHPELTGRENVLLNGAILGMTKPEIRRKFDEIIDFSGVEQFIDTPVKRYSSGMYVRLAFAVAAHLEPEILVVDEVLAVGDAEFQKRCLGKMKDVAQGGRTVLFVSHNLTAVAQLCKSAIWLSGGTLQMAGDPPSLIAAYLSHSSKHVAQRTWSDDREAPGDDQVRILSARVIQTDAIAPVVDINEPSYVDIDFCVLRPATNLLIGAIFFDTIGTCLFATVDWRDTIFSPGHYRKRVSIPAQTFAEGAVHVQVQAVFFSPQIASAVVPDALVFEAVDSNNPLAVRGLYRERWPGVVRLRMDWTKALPQAEHSVCQHSHMEHRHPLQ